VAFRVRDLVINVVPEAQAGGGAAATLTCCRTPSLCAPCSVAVSQCGICSFQISYCDPCTRLATLCYGGTHNCGFVSVCPGHTLICPDGTVICPQGSLICPGGSRICPGTQVCTASFDPVGPVGPEGLAELKAQLQQALKDVEAQEEALNEQMAPKSVEEIEALESRLNAALADLAERKKKLQ